MSIRHNLTGLIILLFYIQVFCGCSQRNMRGSLMPPPPLMQKLIDAQGMPTKNLARLLELTSLAPIDNPAQLIEATQHQYLRPKNLERWQWAPLQFGEHQEEILALLKELGYIDAIHASGHTYQGALVLGGTLTSMRQRIAFLLEEWQRGVRFAKIIGLTGDRARFVDEESAPVLFDKNNGILPLKSEIQASKMLPENELELMKFLFNKSELPDEFSQVPIVYVDARKNAHSDPSNKRITTLDTIRAWLKDHKPEPGKYLVVSSQPYIIYQDSVAHAVSPRALQLESIGPKEVHGPFTIQNALDAIARALYQNYHR